MGPLSRDYSKMPLLKYLLDSIMPSFVPQYPSVEVSFDLITRYVMSSLVPRPIPSFSMFHTEKQDGLIREIT